jgi:hypothetical protein
VSADRALARDRAGRDRARGRSGGWWLLPAGLGPRQGSSTFAVGEEALQPGSYELRINGVNYGTVEITEDSATLVAPVDACE